MQERQNTSIQHPELLLVQEGEQLWFGADQDWYAERWQRQAGCGPNVCTQLMWYLAATRPGAAPLCPYNAHTKAGMQQLMQQIWQYVTPGMQGTNSTARFAQGALRYGNAQGIALAADTLNVPPCRKKQGPQAAATFVAKNLAANRPVAFLNLSNGAETVLESWHWVTIVSFAAASGLAECFDNGNKITVDLARWTGTTLMGGGFVALDVQANQ